MVIFLNLQPSPLFTNMPFPSLRYLKHLQVRDSFAHICLSPVSSTGLGKEKTRIFTFSYEGQMLPTECPFHHWVFLLSFKNMVVVHPFVHLKKDLLIAYYSQALLQTMTRTSILILIYCESILGMTEESLMIWNKRCPYFHLALFISSGEEHNDGSYYSLRCFKMCQAFISFFRFSTSCISSEDYSLRLRETACKNKVQFWIKTYYHKGIIGE